MDSRAVQGHGHEYDEHHNQQVAHGTTEDQHQHDHEKKSVLKKVKAKAKKIKDTITKHGHHDNDEHGHGYHYGDQHIPDDHDLDEEDDDDEDEEMIEDPEVHGAPIYDSAGIRSAQAQNLGKPGMRVEPHHHQPKLVVVSPTTHETDKVRVTDPVRTFVGVREDRGVNLERPMGLEEDPHAPGSRTQAHAPPNYQSKVTDPTGAGGAEIDITPVERSLARMNVHNNEPKPTLPTVPETNYPSLGGHRQFMPQLSTATKTQYPTSTQIHDQQHHFPPLSGEVKTQYPRNHDMPVLGGHRQFMPELSTATKTQYPTSTQIHDQQHHMPPLSSEVKTQYPRNHDMPDFSTATKTQYPSNIGHDQNLSTTTHYPSAAIGHDQNISTTTQYPSAAIGHDQNLSTKTQYPSAISPDQSQPQMSSATRTPYPSVGSHDQFVPELSTDPKTLYPTARSHDQILPQQPRTHHQHTSPISHDHFVPELSTTTQTKAHYPSSGSHDQFNPEPIPTSTNTYNQNPQQLGQAFNTTTTPIGEQSHPQYESVEIPSNQSSYTDKISSATSAIADKAVTAKNAVASKLGYGEQEGERDQNQSSYAEKISSATSAVADKAISAKNMVASKLGYGDEKAATTTTTRDEDKKGENASSANMSGSPTEYGKKIAVSLTEKLAPVYGKVAGVGSAVKSKVPGTGVTGVESDKGVSVKDYFAEKLRPGDEDRALSEVISDTLHKKNNAEENTAVHKRGGEENEGAERKNRPLGKVTESEEVKRRLGSDERTERRYEEAYLNSPGKGVVDKLKGVVGSWFGGNLEENNQSSQQGGEHLSHNSGAEVNRSAGERRLQESSN